MPPGVFHDERGVLDGTDVIVVSTDPQTGRSGAAARIEGGRWTVTVAQANGAAPPIDLPEFTAFVDSLPAPRSSGGSSAPVSRMARVRSTASRRAAGSATSGCAGARSVCSPWVTRCAPSTRCTGRACRRPRCRRPRFATWSRSAWPLVVATSGRPSTISPLEPPRCKPASCPRRGRWRPARTSVFPVCRASRFRSACSTGMSTGS